MIDHLLVQAAGLGALTSAALTVYLLALRLVAWDLIPATALPHVHWWRRHARPILLTALTITTAALTVLMIR